MGSSIILAGLGMAAVGFAGRYAARSAPQVIFFFENLFKGFYFPEKFRVALNRFSGQKCGLYFFQV